MGTLGTVLLAEDRQDDVLLIQKAIERAGFQNPISVVPDGRETINYLKGEDIYADRETFPFPILLILDLNMPGINGLQVLKWLRSQPQMAHLPVVVLTASPYQKDMQQVYELGANSFLVKSSDFEEFAAKIKEMGDFWLARAQVPGAVLPPELPPSPPAGPTLPGGSSPLGAA